jgi:pimeloyl-ACP methyl ester carboxylesterase
MQPSDARVEVSPGVTLRVREWPGDSGPPYLLAHGLSSNALLWDQVAERLSAAGRPSYAVDLRSHGESDAPADGYDTATAAADLAAICQRLALPPVIAVGQSWGGNVVVRLAARHPDLVAGLALVDGGWIDLSTEFDTWEACATALRPPEVDGVHPAQMRAFISKAHPDWSAASVEATVANLRVTPDGRLERRLAIPNHMRILRSMWDDPPWRDYPHITVPVLLMPAVPTDADQGERRRVTVAKAAGALARSRVREYVGADHDLHAQHPGSLADDLLTVGREV